MEVEVARTVLDARYLPPVRRGDLAALAEGGRPDAVGIVDGEFSPGPAVSPKEILSLLDDGIPVFGSSSMGALRAVELEPWGMVGIGRVYEMFRSGELDADDELALVYDAVTLRPYSTPLVDMRLAIKAAVRCGAASRPTARSLVEIARGLHYPERTWQRVLAEARSVAPPDELLSLGRFLGQAQPESKRTDAIALLQALAAFLDRT